MSKRISAVLYCIVGVLVVIFASMFIVDQRQNAIVFRLGEVVRINKAPGLYFKIPLLDNVRYFDVRILTIDTPEPQLFLTKEKKNVQVDLFIKWRISDVRQYYASIVGSSGGNGEALAQTRLLADD
jgi:membrane protease subunit HflC